VIAAHFISVVVPVFREAHNLDLLYARVREVMEAECGGRWELILVNDGSPDDSWRRICTLASMDPRVVGIDLSRNFGKEVALSAGVEHALGEAVVCMDADLQHPPEVIPELIAQWRSGAEIVATRRMSIQRQPLMRRLGSHVYYWLMARISGVEMVSQTTDFRLYDRRVIEEFKRFTERQRMFRAIMDWMGFRKVYVDFEAPAREHGTAGYSYAKLVDLAINSMTSFSLLPLRLSGMLGLAIAIFSLLLAILMVVDRMWLNHFGFTPIALAVVANTFLIGVVLVAIGLVALYIGTIHTEVINRPLYLVRETTRRLQAPHAAGHPTDLPRQHTTP
jgi:polyisoprenyl-phosphate glycosyltransferase